jgi:DNA helicase-2/ATP-dependent DNA helicase PcrA
MSKAFTPSPQQSDILSWIANETGNAVIEAVAGAGKTTTLIQIMRVAAEQGKTVGFFSFAKRIVDEIAQKAANLNSDMVNQNVTIGTMHSIGFKSIRNAYGRTKVEGKGWRDKKNYILAESLRIHNDLHKFCFGAVGKAKSAGIGIVCAMDDRAAWDKIVDHYDLDDLLPGESNIPMAEAIATAIQLLKAHIESVHQIIDFDDMIYIPALKGLKLPQYDIVLNDEAQDTNLLRLAMLRLMIKPGCRIISVGDPAQAIFGFTGAESDSLDKIKQSFNCITLPLSVSYRCPQSVVRVAQQWVSHIQSADNAPEGKAETIDAKAFQARYDTLKASDAILCRNTKPLVTLAYDLLGRGVGCRIEGKDIGEGLVRLATKWKRIKTIGKMRSKLEDYLEIETNKAMAKGHEYKAESVSDRVSCVLTIGETMHDDDKIEMLVDRIKSMFGDTPPGETPRVVTLSTIHKSKGREWPNVYWYGSDQYQPSKYARQDWQMEQEKNLMYVAATRAQETLTIVNTL